MKKRVDQLLPGDVVVRDSGQRWEIENVPHKPRSRSMLLVSFTRESLDSTYWPGHHEVEVEEPAPQPDACHRQAEGGYLCKDTLLFEEAVQLIRDLNNNEPSARYYLARGRATNFLKELGYS